LETKKICVFCGSSAGKRKEYTQAAENLGTEIARRNLGLVFGGGNVGLMDVLANAALKAGGEVIGVIPKDLVQLEVAHSGLSDLKVTSSMHDRKALMAELSSGFIALPGGIGTLEELFEILTWSQLGFHKKPCAILNVFGYFDPLIRFLDLAAEQGFLEPEYASMLIIDNSPVTILDRFAAYKAPNVQKWYERKIR